MRLGLRLAGGQQFWTNRLGATWRGSKLDGLLENVDRSRSAAGAAKHPARFPCSSPSRPSGLQPAGLAAVATAAEGRAGPMAAGVVICYGSSGLETGRSLGRFQLACVRPRSGGWSGYSQRPIRESRVGPFCSACKRLARRSRELILPAQSSGDGRGLCRLASGSAPWEQSGRLLDRLPGSERRHGQALATDQLAWARGLAWSPLGGEALVGLTCRPIHWRHAVPPASRPRWPLPACCTDPATRKGQALAGASWKRSQRG